MKLYDLCQTMEQEHKTFMDMPLRVTFYARVSTKKEAQLNSKENQIETFTRMIEDNPNWEFVDGYVDTVRGESITNKQIDEIVKTLVDRVEVKPINKTSMSITIVLKAGSKGTLEHIRQGTRYACRSGNISKKMTPEQQLTYTRDNRTLKEHIQKIKYNISIAISV